MEKKLGLVGQPKAIVFHEKNGRRHAHCVWSRIDAGELKAIDLSHYKRKLGDISIELYRRHEWDMPKGFRDKVNRDPLNFSRKEGGQAKRLKRDPKEMKALFRQCWEQSDSLSSFQAALKERCFVLARGDRRGFVALDADGKVWSLSRWCGVKPKDLRARLGSEDDLPSIEDVLSQVNDLPSPEQSKPDLRFDFQRSELVARQRKERDALLKAQEERRIADLKARKAKLPTGLKAAFLRVTGRYQALISACERENEALQRKDRAEQQALIEKHLTERRALVREARRAGLTEAFQSSIQRDPRQVLELPADDLPFTKEELLRKPDLVLSPISKTKARFERTDVLRELAKRIDDPLVLSEAANKAIRSPQVVTLETNKTPVFTTRDFLKAEEQFKTIAHTMHQTRGYGVSSSHIEKAIHAQNREMKRAFGGELSAEQKAALHHILSDQQMACVVGLAGAGKSTLLKTAMHAWSRQGIKVHGAALAGKAADGLENASDIQSRTLASLETSWENGHEPIAKGDVLVIDEAGMMGTRQLARIATKINDIGAKLVLVGDPDQLQPIEAGRPFRDLLNNHPAAQLTEIHRQRDDWQKQASRNLAQGNVHEAVSAYEENTCVHRNQDHDQAMEGLVEAYAMDVAANGSDITRLAFAHRRKDVHALNQAIRKALRPYENTNSDAQEEILLQTETGKRAFASGDRIVFARNDKALGVKNGMLGTVQSAADSKMTVELDGEPTRKLTFDPRTYRAFDHGYAVTIHKSQGATVDNAYIFASRTMDRHLAYVAMTRHRDQMRLYINERDKPSWAHKHPQPDWQHRHKDRNRSGPSMG